MIFFPGPVAGVEAGAGVSETGAVQSGHLRAPGGMELWQRGQEDMKGESVGWHFYHFVAAFFTAGWASSQVMSSGKKSSVSWTATAEFRGLLSPFVAARS